MSGEVIANQPVVIDNVRVPSIIFFPLFLTQCRDLVQLKQDLLVMRDQNVYLAHCILDFI
jgi:hypothetical protein